MPHLLLPIFPTRCWLAGASLLAGTVGCQPNTPTDLATAAKPAQRETAQPALEASIKPSAFVFDVPLLLTKNSDQITRLLGSPKEPDSANLTEGELERFYAAKEYRMVVTYETKSREVSGILITLASGPTKDCSKLLAAGNLTAGDPNYSVDSLAGDKPGYYYSLVATKSQ